MKRILSCFAVTILASGSLLAQSQMYGIQYGGGTVPNAVGRLWMAMSVTSDATTFQFIPAKHPLKLRASVVAKYFEKHPDKGQQFTIPSNSIKSISLSQDKHHRVGTGIAISVVSLGAGIPVMFTKSTKDYIAITWDDAGKKGAAEFQADKNDYRALLTALSGASGVPVTAAIDTEAK